MPIDLHLPFQGGDLGVSPLDQADKLSNHSRAFASKGGESPVPICEIPAGSGVAGKLGAAGGGGADVVLQACNAGSISSAASLQGGEFAGVVMGVFLLCGGVPQPRCCCGFRGLLRLPGLGQGLPCMGCLQLCQAHGLQSAQQG